MKNSISPIFGALTLATCLLVAPQGQATPTAQTQTAKSMSSPSGMRSPDRKRPVRKGVRMRASAREIPAVSQPSTETTTVPATGGAAETAPSSVAPISFEASAAALESVLALEQNADFRAWYESPHVFLPTRSRLQNLQFSLWSDDQACIARREGDTKFLRADCAPMTIRISAKVNEVWADSFERFFGYPERAIDSIAYRVGDGSKEAMEKAIVETMSQHGMICSNQSIAPDHQWILDRSMDQVRDVADAVIDTYWSGQRGRLSPRQRVEALTSFVQNAIPYRKVDEGRNVSVQDGKYRCGLRTPTTVLLEGGDCDSKSLLLATLIRSVDERIPVALVYCMSDNTPHMCLAVGCDLMDGEQRINVNGVNMALIETTSDWDIGHVGSGTDIQNAEAQPLR